MWKVKKSKIHGHGIVATTNIKKGTRVIEYIGEKVTRAEGNKRSENRIKKFLLRVLSLMVNGQRLITVEIIKL